MMLGRCNFFLAWPSFGGHLMQVGYFTVKFLVDTLLPRGDAASKELPGDGYTKENQKHSYR